MCPAHQNNRRGTAGEHDQAVDDLLAQDDVLAFGVNELGGEVGDFEE